MAALDDVIVDVLTVKVDLWGRGNGSKQALALAYEALDGTLKLDICGMIFVTNRWASAQGIAQFKFPSQFCKTSLGRRQLLPYPYEWMVTSAHSDTEDTLELIAVNDDDTISEEERRAKITAILRKHHIEVRFV